MAFSLRLCVKWKTLIPEQKFTNEISGTFWQTVDNPGNAHNLIVLGGNMTKFCTLVLKNYTKAPVRGRPLLSI